MQHGVLQAGCRRGRRLHLLGDIPVQAGLAISDVQAAVTLAEQLRLCRLKDKGRIFRETFLAKLGLLLRGTVAAPPERFGETIEDERIRGGVARPRVPGCLTGSGFRVQG